MSKVRKTFVHILIIFVTSMAMIDMVFLREDWPFAAYQMYSGIFEPSTDFSRLEFQLVHKDGQIERIRKSHSKPFDNQRLKYCLNNRMSGEGGDGALLSFIQQIRDQILSNKRNADFIGSVHSVRIVEIPSLNRENQKTLAEVNF